MTSIKLTIIAMALLFSTSAFAAGTAINETGELPDASAILDARSTTKGFLPPRMTETQKNAIATPATGLTIYQTDGVAGLYVYDGSAWKQAAVGTVGIAGGGTGAVDAASARTSLSAAQSGANSDITSLNGLTTPLSMAQGGTGATNQSGAANAILPTQTGNGGKYLTTNGTNVSWGTVNSDSSTITATASGALSAGQLVEFNSDGTVKSIVSSIPGTATSIAGTTPGQTLPGVAGATYYAAVSAIIGGDKVVVAYSQGAASYVVAGILTGTAVTWGTPVQLYYGGWAYPDSICALETDKFAVTVSSGYSGSNGSLIFVGKVTGTVINLGTYHAAQDDVAVTMSSPYQVASLGNNHLGFSSSSGHYRSYTYDSATLAVTYKAQVWPISSPAQGTALVATGNDQMVNCSSGGNWITCYSYNLNASQVPVNVGGVATDTSYTSFHAVRTSTGTNPVDILVVYNYSGSTYARIARIVPDGTMSWRGAAVTLPTPFTNTTMSLANTADGVAVLTGTTSGSNLQAVMVSTGGTVPTFSSYDTLLASGYTGSHQYFPGGANGSGGRFSLAYIDANNSNKPTLLVGQMGAGTTVNRGNATGVVTVGAANGGTATIALNGSNVTGLSGLTPGALYYIQADGTIGTTVTSYYYGLATSATSLLTASGNGTVSGGGTVTVNESSANKVASASGKTAVYTEFSQGDESVRVYANGSSSFYADGHTDSSLNIDRGMVYTTINIANLASGGAIGTAAATVDMGTMFNIAQTTAGQTITLPGPTNTKAGRTVFICNTGSTAFTAYGSASNVTAGSCKQVIWTGAAWAGLVQ